MVSVGGWISGSVTKYSVWSTSHEGDRNVFRGEIAMLEQGAATPCGFKENDRLPPQAPRVGGTTRTAEPIAYGHPNRSERQSSHDQVAHWSRASHRVLGSRHGPRQRRVGLSAGQAWLSAVPGMARRAQLAPGVHVSGR